jgi:hypothetical protein
MAGWPMRWTRPCKPLLMTLGRLLESKVQTLNCASFSYVSRENVYWNTVGKCMETHSLSTWPVLSRPYILRARSADS